MTISRPRVFRFSALALTVLLAAAGGYAVLNPGAQNSAQAQPAAPAGTAVDVAPAIGRPIIDWQRYSGRLQAIDRVDIRPLVSGTLAQVHFKDGALVKKGDLLFTIDPRPYEAQVERAEASAAYTAADLARAKRLLAENAIARRDYDQKESDARAAAAALKTARINLGYTRIAAPIDGRVSRAEVTAGNVVSAGASSAVLTTIVSVSRMYASFNVDEQTFLRYVDANHVRGVPIPVQMGLADEKGYPRRGLVESVDNQLDPGSGTIRVRAVFDNRDGLMVPGLYARVRLGGSAPHAAVLVDEKAIGTDQDKRYVLVLDKANHADYRSVQLGASVGTLRVVTHGLAAGERIVVGGLQRVRPGDLVAPNLVSMDDQSAPIQTASAGLN
ncbi:efflux RND transporter periplasmic adaptor subunit [Bordetella sp. FB-8]|uniref:efflux RND transporter periplasmic adaptor subunit n=1 Tax=Bordetella sp. FB-8 TaxID=1159870 RepID=UPI00037E213B|nr:efflux RND transporter periplasmic adaptor subunit [Bordetella sp. FB-8]